MLSACPMPGGWLEDVQLALQTHRARPVLVQGEKRQAAVAAVLRTSARPEILFIRRAEHSRDPWSGHMAFPGGRVDREDENPLQAAVREAKEEVDLDLRSQGQFLGELSQVRAVSRARPREGEPPLVVHPYVFAVGDEDPALTPDEREVQEVVWVPFDLFLDPKNRQNLDMTYEGQQYQFPCYRFQGRVIWGLTLKMVDELVAVIGPDV